MSQITNFYVKVGSSSVHLSFKKPLPQSQFQIRSLPLSAQVISDPDQDPTGQVLTDLVLRSKKFQIRADPDPQHV